MPIKRWNPDRIHRTATREAERRLLAAAIYLADEIAELMPGMGKPGATAKEREAHRSLPGEPPHVQTGTLKRSITWSGIERTIRGPRIRVGHHKDLVYGPVMEFGRKDGTIAARPHIRPGYDRNLSALRSIMTGR